MGRLILAVIAASAMITLLATVFRPYSSLPSQNGLELQDCNLGPVFVGESTRFSLRAKNHGPSSLEIQKVSGGCSCLDVKSSKSQVQVGEEFEIAGVLSAAQQPGLIKKNISVTTNVGVFSTELHGDIVERIICQQDVIVRKSGIFSVGIQNNCKESVKLTSCNLSGIGRSAVEIITELPVDLLPSQERLIQFRAVFSPLVRESVAMRFVLGHEFERIKTTKVLIHNERFFSVHPQRVSLGVVDFSESMTRSVQLRFTSNLEDLDSASISLLKTPEFLVLKELSSKGATFELNADCDSKGIGLEGQILVSLTTRGIDSPVVFPVTVHAVVKR